VPDYLNKRAEFIKENTRNENEMRKALKDVDIIFHEASVVGVSQLMYQIYKYMEVDTLGTANIRNFS
jgi:dTDP-L-rhamnose 4-epimerase